MSQSRKYRSFGIRRENNLSDIQNAEQALNNLLNNLSGVDPLNDITFISQDLDAIRGLKDTNINPESFVQIAGTAPSASIVNSNNEIIETLIQPLVRLEDRFRQFRIVTENNPLFASGRGPKAFFIPSSLIPAFTKTTKIVDELESDLTNPLVQTSDDFWMLGEFVIDDRIRVDFQDSYGGILWEGFYIPNPSASTHDFGYVTSGLFHVEYDRFGDGNWQVIKSIYSQKRDVLVANTITSNTITLQSGETIYVSVGDFIENDDEAVITEITGNTITLSKEISVTSGQTLTFDMPIGQDTTSGLYEINEILDRAETPQIKKRIFWWFPNDSNYEPSLKYLRSRIVGRTVFDYFFFNQDAASIESSSGSIRELLENALTPAQEFFGESNENRTFTSSLSTETLYVPKSSISEIVKTTTNITFQSGNRSITGTLSSTELGNVIIPNNPTDLIDVVPKNMRIKDLLGSNIGSTARLVNQPWPVSRSSYAVTVIDHNGLVDYFVATSNNDVVTVSDTSNLRPNMICISSATSDTDFVRIDEIVSPTQFKTSSPLNLSNEYLFVYANAGILDRSLDVFCVGVFGQSLGTTAASGTNTLILDSAVGVANGQIVQFGNSIPTGTTVTNVSSNTVTLSNNITQSINQGETVVFAPSGTTVNKEICVLPLDLSPPFIGVDSGLDTNGKSIRSSETSFNLKVDNLTFSSTTVNTANTTESYDTRIAIGKDLSFFMIAKKL